MNRWRELCAVMGWRDAIRVVIWTVLHPVKSALKYEVALDALIEAEGGR